MAHFANNRKQMIPGRWMTDLYSTVDALSCWDSIHIFSSFLYSIHQLHPPSSPYPHSSSSTYPYPSPPPPTPLPRAIFCPAHQSSQITTPPGVYYVKRTKFKNENGDVTELSKESGFHWKSFQRKKKNLHTLTVELGTNSGY